MNKELLKKHINAYKSGIKINNLLTRSGWRFFDDEDGQANIIIDINVKAENSSLYE